MENAREMLLIGNDIVYDGRKYVDLTNTYTIPTSMFTSISILDLGFIYTCNIDDNEYRVFHN